MPGLDHLGTGLDLEVFRLFLFVFVGASVSAPVSRALDKVLGHVDLYSA